MDKLVVHGDMDPEVLGIGDKGSVQGVVVQDKSFHLVDFVVLLGLDADLDLAAHVVQQQCFSDLAPW